MKRYPEYEPAWVDDPENPGHPVLSWLDSEGKPAEAIGVEREGDVPGIHTPAACDAILAMPLEKQMARQWPSIPAAESAPEA